MRSRHFAAALTVLALASGMAACTVKTEAPKSSATDGGKTTGSGATTKTKPKKDVKPSALSGLAKSTPPAGATSKGKQTSPKVGNSTIPISDAEVYLIALDLDGDGVDDPFYWAYSEADGMTYLWSEGSVACADGLSDGTGGFMAAIASDGSGAYFFALDGCPEQNLFGCAFDPSGAETECGACAWSEGTIACAAN